MGWGMTSRYRPNLKSSQAEHVGRARAVPTVWPEGCVE